MAGCRLSPSAPPHSLLAALPSVCVLLEQPPQCCMFIPQDEGIGPAPLAGRLLAHPMKAGSKAISNDAAMNDIGRHNLFMIVSFSDKAHGKYRNTDAAIKLLPLSCTIRTSTRERR
jgi:hypothetical protein